MKQSSRDKAIAAIAEKYRQQGYDVLILPQRPSCRSPVSRWDVVIPIHFSIRLAL